MDEVFKALADPNRRRLLDRLNERNGQTLRELCVGLAMARQSVSKHLTVLEAANLISTRRRGRDKLHFLNPVPINAIAERWMTRYDRARAFTRRYWGVALVSDWNTGSTITWELETVTIADDEQVVIAAEPPRRLSYTWHTVTPEFVAAYGNDQAFLARASAERRSKVTFEIEPAGDLVKLAVTHDDFDPDSVVLAGVSEGWPAIIASLKTMLETGEPLALA